MDILHHHLKHTHPTTTLMDTMDHQPTLLLMDTTTEEHHPTPPLHLHHHQHLLQDRIVHVSKLFLLLLELILRFLSQ
jgi:hypothetical protein